MKNIMAKRKRTRRKRTRTDKTPGRVLKIEKGLKIEFGTNIPFHLGHQETKEEKR